MDYCPFQNYSHSRELTLDLLESVMVMRRGQLAGESREQVVERMLQI